MRRTKEQTAETREALLNAAETVFFRCGVARATLEGIACEAGMTRGALYWHFDNKEAIYAAMLDRVRLPLLETELTAGATGDQPLATLQRFADQALYRIAHNEQIWRVHAILLYRRERLFDAEMDDAELRIRRHIRSAFTEAFRRAEALGQLRAGVKPEFAATAFQCHLMGLLYVGVQEPEAFRLYDDGVQMVRDLLAGYRAD